ncbi:hypothetical protein GW17_00002524 [Ensete ventricosum]|nr:hypothetical protein GW17_00002524 [Ensete ventricosum]
MSFRYFMISGLKGSGVKDLIQYLMDQVLYADYSTCGIVAVKRPWDEDPTTMSEEIMKTISLEVVREKMLDHIHQVSLSVIVKRIGIEANEELRSIFKRNVHLILQVRVARKRNA